MIPPLKHARSMTDDDEQKPAKFSTGAEQKSRKYLKKYQKWMNKLEDCWGNEAKRKGNRMDSSPCSPSLLNAFPQEVSESHISGCSSSSSSSQDCADGFIILNGESLFPSCSPYDCRELLFSENVISKENKQERILRFSHLIPFILVLRNLQKEKLPISFPIDIREVCTTSNPQSSFEEPQGMYNNKKGMSKKKLVQKALLLDSKEKRTVYVLLLPDSVRRLHSTWSSNSLGEALFLLPCRSSLILEHIGHYFTLPVVGVTRGLLHGKIKAVGTSSLPDGKASPSIPTPREIVSIAIPEVPGLFLWYDFLTQEEHDQILAEMQKRDSLQVEYLQHRRVAHFSRRFLYGVNQVGKEGVDVNDTPTYFEWMRRRLHLHDESIRVVGPVPSSFGTRYCDQLTVNYYDYTSGAVDNRTHDIHVKGPGISSHVDSHSAFMEHIFVVSLGSYTVMKFRRWDEPAEAAVPVYLPPCSLTIMSGEARYGWEHSIAERRTDNLSETLPLFHRGDRLSLTWRVCRDAPHFKSSCLYPVLCDGVEGNDGKEV